jgi:hypothetical protein
MTLECESFTATPLESGKMRLVIKAAKPSQSATLTPQEAVERLSELFGKPVKKHSLTYWRKRGLPYTQVSEKKFIYHAAEINRWAEGLMPSSLL